MKTKILITSAILMLAAGAPAMADGHLNSATSKEDLFWFDPAAVPSPTGESRITRTGNMIIILVEPENLVPGDAYTLWFVVFNNPAGCVTVTERDAEGNPTDWVVDGICSDDDFFDFGIGSAQITVGNATGNVAKADGTTELGGRLVWGSNLEGHQVALHYDVDDPMGPLLTADPDFAEVHVVVQTHGQGRGGKKLLEQLTYINANCTPICEDIQFAVHLAPLP